MGFRALPLSLLLVCGAGGVAAQSGGPRPAIAVLNLWFDGEHANVLEPGDTAVAQAATSRLLETLRVSEAVTVTDSARVAAAVAAQAAAGTRCDRGCAVAVGRALRAQWVAIGTLTKTSDLVWVLSAELCEVGTGTRVLADGYEIKGDAMRMAPAGARVFAQRIEKTIGARR